MQNEFIKSEIGLIVEESDSLSQVTLCHCCSLSVEKIIKMVERGLVDPIDASLSYSCWQFSNTSLLRV